MLPSEINKQLNIVEKNASETVLSSTPVRISMNLTGKCNIRCIFCHLALADYYSNDELSLDLFKKLDPFLTRASHLVYFSSTEPLSARYFNEIFDYSIRYDAEKYLSTNGIQLTEDIAQMFVQGNLYYLTVSLAGTTRESYKRYHRKDAFDTVIDNLKRLNRIKKHHNLDAPHIRLVFVTMRSNMHMLPDIVRLAHELECDVGVKITYFKSYTEELLHEIPFNDRERVIHYTQEAIELGNTLGVPVNFDGDNFAQVDFEQPDSAHKNCYEPYERFHIEADGKVRVCPCMSCKDFAGDLNTQSPEEIWNGEVYRRYRETVNSETQPEGCSRCTHNFHKDFKRKDIWDLTDFDLGIYKRKKNA